MNQLNTTLNENTNPIQTAIIRTAITKRKLDFEENRLKILYNEDPSIDGIVKSYKIYDPKTKIGKILNEKNYLVSDFFINNIKSAIQDNFSEAKSKIIKRDLDIETIDKLKAIRSEYNGVLNKLSEETFLLELEYNEDKEKLKESYERKLEEARERHQKEMTKFLW